MRIIEFWAYIKLDAANTGSIEKFEGTLDYNSAYYECVNMLSLTKPSYSFEYGP